jgi:hypothetical protein
LAGLQNKLACELASLQAASEMGLRVEKTLRTTYREGIDLKRYCRLAIGVDYALDEVLNRKKTGAAAIAKHSKDIQAVLNGKRCPLPKYLERLLQAMEAQASHAEASGEAAFVAVSAAGSASSSGGLASSIVEAAPALALADSAAAPAKQRRGDARHARRCDAKPADKAKAKGKAAGAKSSRMGR